MLTTINTNAHHPAPLDPLPTAEPIITADYPDFESFWAKVQEAWEAQWQTVFGADWQGAWRSSKGWAVGGVLGVRA